MNAMTIATVQSQILTLPNRPPFMLASALAEFYGTTNKRIGEAVKRNPGRFPERFAFRLTEDDFGHLRSQNATAISSMDRSQPLAFTHAGAYALSAVLKTPRAEEVSVLVFDAFAQLQDMTEALVERDEVIALLKRQLFKLQTHLLAAKPLWNKFIRLFEGGYHWYSIRWMVGRSERECLELADILVDCGLLPDNHPTASKQEAAMAKFRAKEAEEAAHAQG